MRSLNAFNVAMFPEATSAPSSAAHPDEISTVATNACACSALRSTASTCFDVDGDGPPWPHQARLDFARNPLTTWELGEHSSELVLRDQTTHRYLEQQHAWRQQEQLPSPTLPLFSPNCGCCTNLQECESQHRIAPTAQEQKRRLRNHGSRTNTKASTSTLVRCRPWADPLPRGQVRLLLPRCPRVR